MPLYEYQCKQCHSLTERIQKFSDPPLTVCPHCGGEVEQTISAPAVQFKGAGWYVTDYAKKPSKADSGSGKSNGSRGSSSPSGESGSSSSSGNPKTEGSKAESSGSSSKESSGEKFAGKETAGDKK